MVHVDQDDDSELVLRVTCRGVEIARRGFERPLAKKVVDTWLWAVHVDHSADPQVSV